MSALELSIEDLERLLATASALTLEYWDSLPTRRTYPQLNGAQLAERWAAPWNEEPLGPEVLGRFHEVAEASRASTGRFLGYVFGSGEPVSAIGDLLTSALNANVTSWRSAPAAASIERTVVGWLAEAVGCAGFTGSLCGGGSAANLMGLAMAREASRPANEHGVRGDCTVYASSEVHMSIPKSMALLGLGRDNLRLIPCDEDFQLRTDELQKAIDADRRTGKHPLAIVATAGTVNTGAIDPLLEMARVAKAEQLWMHVDGAYGALAAIAQPERFAGLERADSLSLDAHKWLYQPADCSCLLFRDHEHARRAFSFSGDYVKVLAKDEIEGFAFFDESIELTRRFRALKLWLSLSYHGRAAFKQAIKQDLQHAQRLARLIADEPELEVLSPVGLSTVCFRHRKADNREVLRRLIDRGKIYISNATIRGEFALRACFVNHRTTDEDVSLLIREVLTAATEA